MRYGRLASNLHTNPKVFSAGRNGRDVFVWLLCKNAELELDGRVPASYVEPAFTSHMLRCDARDVTDGLACAERAGLIRRLPDDTIEIIGWTDEWRPGTDGKTRTRDWRERKRARAMESPAQSVTVGDTRDVTAVTRDGCDVVEESRVEESRGDKRERPRRAARAAPKAPLPDAWVPSQAHGELASELRVPLDREVAKFRDYALANDRRQADWDRSFSGWLRRAAEYARPGPVNGHSRGGLTPQEIANLDMDENPFRLGGSK